MMQAAAIGLGVQLHALVEAPDGSAAQVIPRAPVGGADDEAAIRELLAATEVLTFEHEHVPTAILERLEAEGIAVRPGSFALRHAQDKIVMRRQLTELGVPCPEWAAVSTEAELADFGDRVGWPVVVKTARGGYDGKGVRVVGAASEAADWLAELPAGEALLAEARVPFTRELAVLLARRPSGEMRAWPVAQTVQRDGVCAEVYAPAPGLADDLAAEAQAIGERIATGLDVTGVLAVELFEVASDAGQGRLFVNELAMRPHNSGHWTIDGAATSQFEQHLRAVLDLPLGPTHALADHAVMANLLGSQHEDPSQVLETVFTDYPQARVHLYGKSVRPGRKLGHVTVTVTGDSLAAARDTAAAAVDALHRKRSPAPR